MNSGTKYDLEERTFAFAKNVRAYCAMLKRTLFNIDDIKQVIRSSGSVGANYIEANESISSKDFVHRIKICRKEAKETLYWLQLIDVCDFNEIQIIQQKLIQEAKELTLIFAAILRRYESKAG